LRVLHVIPSVAPSRGGPSQAVIQMVATQISIGIDAHIATTNDDSSGVLDIETNKVTNYKGAPTIFFERYSPQNAAIREFAYSTAFVGWLRGNIQNYDIIHVHAIFSFCSSYAMYLARKRNVPYLVHTMGQLDRWSLSQSPFRKKIFLLLLEKNNLQQANAIQFTSNAEQSQALELYPKLNSKVIPLGTSTPALSEDARTKLCDQHKLNEKLPILLFMARLHHKKGLEILINALAEIKSPFQLLIAGSGDSAYTKQLTELIDRRNISTNCSLLGFVAGEQKNLLLQGSDLFVLTSHAENFGIAVLEAMISGTPPLVTQGVALSEQITHSNTGWVCKFELSSIVEKIDEALSDKNKLSIKGQDARDYAMQNFQWSAICERLKTLYEELRLAQAAKLH